MSGVIAGREAARPRVTGVRMELQDPAPITSASPEILPFKLLPLFFLSDIHVLPAMYVKRGSLSCISGGQVLKLLTDILWKVALKDFFKTNYLFLILKKALCNFCFWSVTKLFD